MFTILPGATSILTTGPHGRVELQGKKIGRFTDSGEQVRRVQVRLSPARSPLHPKHGTGSVRDAKLFRQFHVCDQAQRQLCRLRREPTCPPRDPVRRRRLTERAAQSARRSATRTQHHILRVSGSRSGVSMFAVYLTTFSFARAYIDEVPDYHRMRAVVKKWTEDRRWITNLKPKSTDLATLFPVQSVAGRFTPLKCLREQVARLFDTYALDQIFTTPRVPRSARGNTVSMYL